LFQRFIDFVSGAVYSMEGKIEKISQYVFLFAPPNVCINAEDKKKFISESAAVNKKTFLDS
jgi:cell division inhibitor SepF